MSEVKTMTVKELHDLRQASTNHLLLDVRTDAEVAIDSIPDSKHIVMDEIPEAHGQLNKNEKIIVYCRSGMRSARVAEFLIDQGFVDVTNLEGGILSWMEEIAPQSNSTNG
jgi:adenylyltransferase/sulfurtransferase